MRTRYLIPFICLLLIGCKSEDSGKDSDASASSATKTVPGCDSGGEGVGNNPHCQPVVDPPVVNPPDVWIRSFTSANSFSSQNTVTRVAVDHMNSVVAVGYTYDSFDGSMTASNYPDAIVVKYDSTGNKLWASQFGGQVIDVAAAVTIDGSDNIYVTGSSSANINDPDIFVRKYSPDGVLQWSKQFANPADQTALAIEVSASGNIYVGGVTFGSFGGTADMLYGDAYVIKLSSSGSIVWKRQMGSAGSAELIKSIKIDSAENLYVGGTNILAELDVDGNILWQNSMQANVFAVALSSDGNLFLTGIAGSPINGQQIYGAFNGFVAKYDDLGNNIWTKIFGETGVDSEFMGLTLDSNNNPIASGYLDHPISITNGNWGALTVKYSNNGDLLFAEAFGNERDVNNYDVALDSNGRIITVGKSCWTPLDGTSPGVSSGFIRSRGP